MEPMIKEYVLSIVRQLLAPIVVFLAATGYISNEAAVNLVAAIAAVVVGVVWSLANKYLWKKTTEGALKTQAAPTETTLKNIIASSGTSTTSPSGG